MARLVIANIKGLVQVRENWSGPVAGKDMASLPMLSDAYVIINNGLIEDYGPMAKFSRSDGVDIIDATGRYVFPSFVDSHSHLVFAASREEEFVMKIKGVSYEEIASKGGGILNSARKLQAMSEDDLFERARLRAQEIVRLGTGAIEIKSGYGLTLRDEVKMLKVARRIGRETPLTVKTTFLGAHAVPSDMRKEDYIKLVVEEMLPVVAEAKLADYIDVFCEQGFFSVDESVHILEAGKRYGLTPRVHANQLHRSGGVQVGVRTGAVSVDHLENIGDEEVLALKHSHVMPTALPGAAFFLGLPFTPARKLIDAGLPLAIASDYNPGSSPSGNMQLMVSLACIKMKMTPEEAINAVTLNTATTMGLDAQLGSITRGKIANIMITKPIPSIAFMPYSFGSSLVETVILNGKIIHD